MTDQHTASAPQPAADGPRAEARPAYEPPRVVKKKAVTRATLFSGGGGDPPPAAPLVSNG